MLKVPPELVLPSLFCNRPYVSQSCSYRDEMCFYSKHFSGTSTWLNDDDAPVAARVNQYLQSLLGLGTLYSKDEAEKYQVRPLF